jgi:microsomal dipeptidase-like Zn-dependent dipeptidase
MTAQVPQSEPSPRVPLGGDYWEADPKAPLWGFADLHAHLMAHVAFGGKAFWGQPYDPQHPRAQGIEYALSSCEPIHGGLLNVNPEFGHPAGGGWPEFIIWPRFTTLVHQQAYIDWLYRAYQGGLRLITCLAVNNELLASKTNPNMPHDDKSAIQAQIAAMKEMVAFVDAQGGGPGKGWLQIVYTPEEARSVVGQNRLAVILGVEVDSLGNWRRVEDLEKLCRGDLKLAREVIGQELDWLYGLGVRQITPIHLINNAFGGTAIYLRFLETVNLFVTGERWTVEDAWETGVRYRIDHDGADLVDDAERTVAVTGRHLRAMHRRTLLDHIPGVRDMYEAVAAPRVRGGHANERGLNQYGKILLQEMMKRGIIIDVDHMSEKSTETALTLAEENSYPVICSHTWFRDLLFSAQIEFDPKKREHYGTSDVHKVAHEAGKRGDQIERISRLGGMVAPILNQGDIAGLRWGMPDLAGKIAEPCAGTGTSFAQAYLYAVAKTGGRGVALGSDINGAAGLPGPRFGTFAAYGAHNDESRVAERRGEIDRQTNGVAYTTPIRDYRWHRFESSGDGAYDEEECDIWQAIAQYEAGFNPLKQEHPASDFPDANVREALKRAQVVHLQDWVDNLTKGFWMADLDMAKVEDQIAEWPEEQRAAYFSRKESLEEGQHLDERTLELMNKIKAIWEKWGHMKGNNPPLVRSTAGPHRDFDINLDGMAHYGMLPDLLQDLRNIGLTAEDLTPLFRSANDYIEMWDKCEQRAQEGQRI